MNARHASRSIASSTLHRTEHAPPHGHAVSVAVAYNTFDVAALGAAMTITMIVAGDYTVIVLAQEQVLDFDAPANFQ